MPKPLYKFSVMKYNIGTSNLRRSKIMKKFIALLMSALLLTLSVACGDKGSDLEYVKAKGELIVGITDFEPMDYKESSSSDWTGFDAELARMVGEKLGVKVSFQEINWKTKETELAAKTIDCIWNGLTWDSDRAANMSMSDYYMVNKQVVVVRSGEEDKLSADKISVAVESGSAGEELVNEKMANATIIEKDSQIDALTELVAGTVDAAAIDYTMANYLINKEGSNFASLTIAEGAVEAEDEYYSIAFRKGSDITEAVNKYLAELREDGSIETLARKYGLESALYKGETK